MPLSVSTRSSIPSTCAFVKLVWPPSLAPYFSSRYSCCLSGPGSAAEAAAGVGVAWCCRCCADAPADGCDEEAAVAPPLDSEDRDSIIHAVSQRVRGRVPCCQESLGGVTQCLRSERWRVDMGELCADELTNTPGIFIEDGDDRKRAVS